MARLSDIQAKVRKSKKWAFLAEMLGETRMEVAVAGVNHRGVLLVNPDLLLNESTEGLVDRVRREFKTAQELRKGVKGFV